MNTPVLHHTHILCRDLELMLKFWTEAIGAKIVRRRKFFDDDGAELDVGALPTLLYVRQIKPGAHERVLPCLGYDHVGMAVKDMDTALEKILRHPLASLHVKPGMAGTLKYAFVKGPDDILVELLQETAAR
ncbi:MAG: VOC family protein [Methylobacteriaceae bacterium]|jgi:catechol 2,3-dioxygenase-like lactoylglutathione lyase family enzyme|nr:VOC family protein [Methylobacteriaceae bacterium]